MSADKGIVPFVVSLLVCWFACNLPADTWPIRIKVQVFRGDADGERLVSALSGEFRKLDGVTVEPRAQPERIRGHGCNCNA